MRRRGNGGGEEGEDIFLVIRGVAGGYLASERRSMNGVTVQGNDYSLDLRHMSCPVRCWNKCSLG